MQQMEIAAGTGRRIVVAREDKIVRWLDSATAHRLRAANEAFRQERLARPAERACISAFHVGARVFEVPVAELRAYCRNPEIAEIRQQLMAFCRVVGGSSNSLKGIGRCFNRHHATVLYATRKYGGVVGRIIGGREGRASAQNPDL